MANIFCYPRKSSPDFSRSEEHTSELQSHHPISYAVFCLKKKNIERGRRESIHRDEFVVSERFAVERGHHAYYLLFFFFNDTATTEIYTGWYTLSLHDALPICSQTSASMVRLRQSRSGICS